jgi:acetyl esterase/lipase
LNADLGKGFIVAGLSAGGNIAAVASHVAEVKDKLTGVVLACPVLLHPQAVPEKWRSAYGSWEEQKDAVILDQRGMEWFYGAYKC